MIVVRVKPPNKAWPFLYFTPPAVIEDATSIISSRVNFVEARKNETPSFSQLIDVSVIAPIVKPKSAKSPAQIQAVQNYQLWQAAA